MTALPSPSAVCPECSRTLPGMSCARCGHVATDEARTAMEEPTMLVPRRRGDGSGGHKPIGAKRTRRPTVPQAVAGVMAFGVLGFMLAWAADAMFHAHGTSPSQVSVSSPTRTPRSPRR